MKEGKERAVDRCPDWGGEGAIQQEVPQGLRGLSREETPTEETGGVGWATATANTVSVVEDVEEGVAR